MQKDANLYNLTQQVQGTMFQAGQKQYLASLNDEERDGIRSRSANFRKIPNPC